MATAEKQTTAIAKKSPVDIVAAQIKELQEKGQLHFPANYSVGNALASAWLTLQGVKDKEKRPVLQSCTHESIINSLLDMAIQGLNPSKKQCHFVAFGNVLLLLRSYFGTVAVTKRVTHCKDVFAEPVYEADEFEYQIVHGNKRVTKHTQSLKNVDKTKIVAAYCTIIPAEGEPYTEIMTMAEIEQAWTKSQNQPFDEKGHLRAGSVHGQFTGEMAKKTVIGRTCKMFINSSMDDSLDLVVQRLNRSDDEADEAEFQEEVAKNANSQTIEAEFEQKPEEESMPEPEVEAKPAEKPAEKPAPKVDPKKAKPEF
jgi:recombination protein RecT